MPDEPAVTVSPHGFEGEAPNGPAIAVIRHRGVRLELRFAPGDVRGEGEIQELRLLPDVDELTPRVLRKFAPDAELYVQFARAAMRHWDPEEDPATKQVRLRDAAEALRVLSGPGRGLTDEFYKRIGETYNALVAEGEPHPVKTLSEIHHVTISAASRWIKEARRRGKITAKGGDDA